MTEQTKAQRLAEIVKFLRHPSEFQSEAAAELLRLDANEAALVEILRRLLSAYSYYFPKGTPWSDDARALITRIKAERGAK